MPDDLLPGVYEELVTTALDAKLANLDPALLVTSGLRSADAADRIALHLANQIIRTIEAIPEQDRVTIGMTIARRLITELVAQVPRSAIDDQIPSGDVLHGIAEWLPDGSVRKTAPPLIPLLDTTLLTNSPGEPRVGMQILTEIESADAVDMVMAFVRRTGLRPLISALRAHGQRGRRLRVLTTTYTGSTEPEALDLLAELGAEIRVSYDVTTTRLHAKAWLFHRRASHSTAYIGSSNLTHSAQVAGLEWNVRVSGARNPDIISKMDAVFDSYWESGDFVPYDREQFAESIRRDPSDRTVTLLSPIEIRLEPFQERLLEQVRISRESGHHRNLLVSATGTGKTVMAAVDYAHLRRELPRDRLLFVAHRQEILDQSRAMFRHALRDHTFGERWVAGDRPKSFDHVFASIQSLSASGLATMAPDHFDVVIIDEFHHAAAPTYQALLEHLQPRELIGLTATPERADGLPVLHWFGDRIAAELRLWDAIEQQRLVPFAYYGIHDGVDLRDIPWRRGQGYDTTALSNVYTSNDAWVRLVYNHLVELVDDVSTMRCFGFCVGVKHAEYMAEQFSRLGVASVALSGNSSDQERSSALRRLAEGSVQVVFTVDLFNEGVDVPSVDTILMLRPTESATLFLQQLGRGLRKSVGKSACTVLDFVGTHRQEFRFDLRYRGLLGGTRKDLENAVRDGFPFLPAGCHLHLDRVASEVILKSIRNAIPSQWPAKVAELRSLYLSRGRDIALDEYLAETGLELSDVYAPKRSWSELRADAGLPTAPAGPNELALRRATGRMLHIDDVDRVQKYADWLRRPEPPRVSSMSVAEARLARMLAASVGTGVIAGGESAQQALDRIWMHPQVRAEIGELVTYLGQSPSHRQHRARADIPLQVHASYTRIEILAAVGEGDAALTPQWREGVYHAKGVGADLLAFTLDKTSGGFSPTTRYRDYAISRELIHWESQSTTRADNPTGLRYRNHVAMNHEILLFARTHTDDRAFWYLGPATYVRHEGERPMAVTWRLTYPLSGDLFAEFAAAVA